MSGTIAKATLSNPHLVTSLPKNAIEEVRIQVNKYQGNLRVDIRTFVDYNNTGHGPTKKGVSLPVEQIPALIKGLQDALVLIDSSKH